MLFLFSITWGAASGWWSLLCVLAGALYAWLLYRNPLQLSRPYRTALAMARAVTVSLIGLLLVGPMVKTTAYRPQKPLILIAQDNSASIHLFHTPGFNPQQLTGALAGLQQQLGNDYEVHNFHFNQQLHPDISAAFNGKQTNISAALQQLNERYVNQNVGAVILATDGLYTIGADPEAAAQQLKTAVYTIAMGDTTLRRDARINNVNYNKTALSGNDFIMEVLTEADQCRGQTLRLTVAEDGRAVQTQNLPVTADSYHKTVAIKLHAGRKGLHRFTISLSPLVNEATYANNTQTVYIEVLDARQKVLLVYASPHPDVSVIKQAIEQNKNYEVKAVSAAQLNTVKPADYNLVILHQTTLIDNAVLKNTFGSSSTPIWYVLGAQGNLAAFNSEQQVLQINSARQDWQEVFAAAVPDFTAFTVTDSTLKKVTALPPLLAPFGNYSATANAQVLLKQKIGNVASPYPLLLFGKAGSRPVAVLTGEGLWRWQLSEYATYGNHHAIEELIGQSVQFLTANASRQRFRVYPAKNVFNEGEEINLNAELYNEALELVNTPEVSLTLKSNSGKLYSYQFSRTDQSYQLGMAALPPGEYTYISNTRLGNTPFTASGRFSVQPLNAESLQSAANHALLKRVARQSGGVMLLPGQVNRLAALIKQNENIKTIEYADQHYAEAIELNWVLGLILLLLSVEWILRKREGEL
ncbi:vWA domain-containing protein [Mucilaginibacter sp.]